MQARDRRRLASLASLEGDFFSGRDLEERARAFSFVDEAERAQRTQRRRVLLIATALVVGGFAFGLVLLPGGGSGAGGTRSVSTVSSAGASVTSPEQADGASAAATSSAPAPGAQSSRAAKRPRHSSAWDAPPPSTSEERRKARRARWRRALRAGRAISRRRARAQGR